MELAQDSLLTEASARELEALYRADAYLYRHLQLEQVLQAIAEAATEILGADKSGVMVWDASIGRLVSRASRGFSAESMAMMSYLPGEGVAGRVFVTGEPVIVEDFNTDTSSARQVADREGIRAILSVPIKIGQEIFGVFGMNYCRPRTFSPADVRISLALAQRAALAIENARLYAQAQQAAALEERRRLARELHDSVTQSLYSLTLLAEAARRLSEAGNAERVTHLIGRLGDTAVQALKEMRLLVYELRPLDLENQDLVGALRSRLGSVEERGGIKAELRIDGQIDLPPAIEGELYRIATEALNNSLKYSGATSVTVQILVVEGRVELVVADNGTGFAPEEVQPKGGVGLHTMRERAERLGGTFSIMSVPGAGTQVRVSVKLPNDAEA